MREKVTAEQIRNLNLLAWDKKIYANCSYNGNYFLEINYYLGGEAYRYRVDCKDKNEADALRLELDENCYLSKNEGVCTN